MGVLLRLESALYLPPKLATFEIIPDGVALGIRCLVHDGT